MGPGERAEGRPKIARRFADPDFRAELRFTLEHGLVAVWDDLSDEKRQTLLAYSELVCPSCGNLREVCSDPTRDWYPAKVVCRATAARDLTVRRLMEKYPTDPKRAVQPHPLDGVGVGMLLDDPDPDEKFFDLAASTQPVDQPVLREH